MDKAIFIKKLRDLFFTLNKEHKRYSEVWLSDVDYGGLYYSGKYKLNLKSEQPLGIYKSEIEFILDLLRTKLDKEEMPYIYTMKIYENTEFPRPEYGDIILYTDEVAYHAA